MRSIVILSLTLGVTLTAVGCAVEATEGAPAIPAAKLAPIPGAAPGQLGGTVLETLDASSYTYVRFESADGEAWAAVPRAEIEVGSTVVIANPMTMSGFESKALGRSFETIYFGTLADRAAPPAGAMGGANPHAAAIASSEAIDVEPATGPDGRTVAQLHATGERLAGQLVELRGRVVKYSAGIMGRNWIHLQDGTGDPADGTNDVTVTTDAATAVGETILVRGTLAVDKDFGAGYRYAVIVEGASIE